MREARQAIKKTKNAIRYWIVGESALIGIVFLCILGGWIVWNIFDINRNVFLIRQSVGGLYDAAVSLNIDALKERSAESVDAIHAIRTRFSFFRFASWLPVFGKQYDASARMVFDAEKLLEDGERVVAGFDEASRLARRDTGELSFQRLSPEQKRIVIQKIFELLPLVAGIESHISLSIAHLDLIDDESLIPAVRSIKQEFKNQLTKTQEALRTVRPFIELFPLLAGYPQERTFLFLLQNNAEVRATGGFIGTYGILKIKDGQLTSFFTDNVYNLDDPAAAFLAIDPPPPFLRYFPPANRHWFLRDSNWFPSFDESARQAEWFYSHEGGRERLDGVIAITPDVLSSFLALSGPIIVEGREFRADNAADEIEFQVERGYYQRGLPSGKRKEIIGTLTARVLESVGNFSFEQWRALIGSLSARVSEKHILVYVNDIRLQEIVKTLGAAGDILQTDGDYLMVVDSNMRSMKTDAVMKKEILYALSIDEKGDARGTVSLRYTNIATPSWKTTTYRDWVRIYVPDESVFLDAIGVSKNDLTGIQDPVEQSRDHNKTVFSAFFSVPSKESRIFKLTYQLPKRISHAMKEGTYSLILQKQSGASGVSADASLVFPATIENVSFDGEIEAQKTEKNTLTFSTILDIDKKIDVKFSMESKK